jgi:hypothetical protein
MASTFAIIERHRREILVGWTCMTGTLLALHARTKLFWHDEIYTLVASRLSVASLWRASVDGLDLAPPLNTVLTKLAHALQPAGPIVSRLPAMVGLLSATWLVFAMARHRANTVVGLTAALALWATPAVLYGDEARGYGVAVGLYALALYGWSEASAGRHTRRNLGLMAFGLAAGVWTHYFSALAFLPIAVGEFVRQGRQRPIDRGPWIALAAAGLATLPLVELVLANRGAAATFWTTTQHLTIRATYWWLVSPALQGRVVTGLEILAALAVFELGRRLLGGPSTRRVPAHDVAAGLVAVALPAIGVWLGHLAGGLIIERYVVFTTVGLALALPIACWRLTPDSGLGDLILCLAFLLPFLRGAGHALPDGRPSAVPPLAARPALARALDGRDLVVITGGVDFLQLWFYATPAEQGHAVYLADPAAELAFAGDDSVDRGYLALGRWSAVPIGEASRFLAGHDTFWLYRFDPDWLSPRLRQAGATFTPVETDPGGELVRVQLPPRAAAPRRD